MLICTNCQAQQLDGTIFCLECGASMTMASGVDSTRHIGSGDGPQTAGLGTSFTTDTAAEASTTVRLLVAQTGRRLVLDLSDERLIGRSDAARGIMPDIDLGPEGGYDAGVSRRHAILSQRNGVYIIEDLGSANGTFVNGRRLAPQAAVQLNNGDELKCGTLVMLLEISA